MSEPNSTVKRDQCTERINQCISGFIVCVLLSVGGFVAFQNRDHLAIPDRNKLWADFWKKELSKPSGLPQFDKPVSTSFSNVKFDGSMLLQTQTIELDSPAFQPESERTAPTRTWTRLERSKSR